VAVAVVDVRDVRVLVDDGAVGVDVLVASAGIVAVLVIVVVVAVGVLVVVDGLLVGMGVLVLAAQHAADTERREHDRHDLAGGGGVAEHGPGDDRADERNGREDELAAYRPGSGRTPSRFTQ
jgi:hypothetical protein